MVGRYAILLYLEIIFKKILVDIFNLIIFINNFIAYKCIIFIKTYKNIKA